MIHIVHVPTNSNTSANLACELLFFSSFNIYIFLYNRFSVHLTFIYIYI